MTGLRKRIAIIGVHGVGEHDPGVTARGIARQLQHTQDGKYQEFEETQHSLPVNGQTLNPIALPKPKNSIARGFGAVLLKVVTPGPGHPIDIQFSQSLLSNGEAYRSIYATTKLSGVRTVGGQATGIDIHELYWTDLSHSSTGLVGMFDQIVQLLMHVASFGRTVSASILRTTPTRDGGLWKIFYRLNALSYWLLSMPIAVGNLILALLALLLGPAMVPQIGDYAIPATALEFLLLFVAGDALMRRYERSRPGVLVLWRGAFALLLVWIVAVIRRQPPVENAPVSSLVEWLGHAVEAPFVALAAIWLLLYLVNLVLLVLALILRAITPDANIRRSINTTLIAASVPAPLFLSLILTTWAVAYHAFSGLIGKDTLIGKAPFEPWCHFLSSTVAPGSDQSAAQNFISGLINQGANPFFLVYVVLMLAAAVLLVGGALPSVIAEISPPDNRSSPSVARAKWLGHWLDGGFTAFGLAAVLAGIGFFLVLPAGTLVQHSEILQSLGDKFPFLQEHSQFIAVSGKIFSASAVTFLAATKLFASNMNFLAKLRVPIDTALDVDNWLRERPVGGTPRLKIFARFAALLHHVRAGDYDEIVFVAHSQGTVIVTDFLRYMVNTNPALLDKSDGSGPLQLSLLSVGSPLRQLYALRFPIFYSWVDRPPNGVIGGPDPAVCGLKCWVNSYGSGDYVGRYLWYADNNAARWTAVPYPSPSHRNASEQCIGPWAHTHYLDEDNYTIGDQLDGLIA